MTHLTRRQTRHWLQPIRKAFSEIKAGEVDTIRGYPVTRIDHADEYARTDWAINGFVALLERLLADEALRARWRQAPCTRTGHHAYLGGLLEHTVAVATLAVEACALHVRLNSDLLITAALA